MNERQIKRTAKKFIKNLKGKVDFASVEYYLGEKYGYKVIFFNTLIGDREISRYNLTEDAKMTDAFTYSSTAKIVFINNNCSSEEKLYLLYHESGHIALGHMDYPRLTAHNKVLLDIKADVFAHSLIQPPKPSRTVLSLIATVAILTAANFLPSPKTVETSSITTEQAQYVFIAPTGKKYHRESCIYVKNKDCSTITKKEAENTHTPCLVCNP